MGLICTYVEGGEREGRTHDVEQETRIEGPLEHERWVVCVVHHDVLFRFAEGFRCELDDNCGGGGGDEDIFTIKIIWDEWDVGYGI